MNSLLVFSPPKFVEEHLLNDSAWVNEMYNNMTNNVGCSAGIAWFRNVITQACK